MCKICTLKNYSGDSNKDQVRFKWHLNTLRAYEYPTQMAYSPKMIVVSYYCDNLFLKQSVPTVCFTHMGISPLQWDALLIQGILYKIGNVISFCKHDNCSELCNFSGYMSTLPEGDETMLHSVHIVIIWRMAISDIPVPICWRIHRWSYPTTAVWRILGRLYPTAVDVVSRGIPHSESVNTLHFRDCTLFEGSLIKIYFISCLTF